MHTALMSGGMAGMAVDICLYPLDTLKTRLQSSQGFVAAGGFKNIYRGIGETVESVILASFFASMFYLGCEFVEPMKLIPIK